MKKLLLILMCVVGLSLGSCQEYESFDTTPTERVVEVQEGTEAVLTAAPNGWQMQYYPELEYGGALLFMKFENGVVTMANQSGMDSSYYSYGQDYGVTINFDTYNDIFHAYSTPDGAVGSSGVGMGGDFEFRIDSYSAHEVVLTGKKHHNKIVMTPLPDNATWDVMFDAYEDLVMRMESLYSYNLTVGANTYVMQRVTSTQYASTYFEIAVGSEVIAAPYVYTLTGINFYEPLIIDEVTIESMVWNDSEQKLITVAGDATIGAPELADVDIALTVSAIDIATATVTATPPATDTYVMSIIEKRLYDSLGDGGLLKQAISAGLETLTGEQSTVYSSLKPGTDYIAFAFGVDVQDGVMSPSSKLCMTPFSTVAQEPGSPEYEAWMGTWEVTSATSEIDGGPLTYQFVIQPNINNESLFLYGWDTSVLRWDYPFIATFNPADGSFSLAGQTELLQNADGEGGVLYAWAMCTGTGYENGVLVSGSYPAITVSSTGDGVAEGSVYSGTLSNGVDFTVWNVVMAIETTDGLYTYNTDTSLGWTTGETPRGPFTLRKISSSTTLPGAPQVSYTAEALIFGADSVREKFANHVEAPMPSAVIK